MLPAGCPQKELVDLVSAKLHADDYFGAAQLYAGFVKLSTGARPRIETKTECTTLLATLLHWLLENDGYEEAAQLLWGPTQFDPRPDSTRRVWKAFEESNQILLMGAGSMSKCLEPNTLCRMDNGSVKRAADIIVGDKLAGDDGTPRTVIERHDGADQMYRVTPHGAPAFECNGDHILSLVCTHSKKNHGGKYGVSSGYTEGNIVDVPLKEWMTWSQQRKEYHKLFTRSSPMPERPVDVDPYIFGVWLGDGTCKRMELTAPSGPMQAEWCRYWESRGGHVVDRRQLPSCGTWFVESEFLPGRGKARRWCKWARSRVVNGEKRIGDDYLFNSEKSRLDLLAGIIDADGTSAGAGFDVVTKWIGLADDIEQLARSLGFLVTRRTRKHGIKSTGFSASYHHVFIIGDCSRIPTREKEPARTSDRGLQHGFSSTRFSVDAIGAGKYAGFGIDGNHRFLLASGIVTHNSFSMGVRLFLEWVRDPEYTTVKVVGPTAEHLKDNLFSHLVTLHRTSSIPLPGTPTELFIGTDTRARKGSITGVVVPLGKSGAGRLQGVKRSPRKKPHPTLGNMARLFIFLDEIANIPLGIWRDITNLLSGMTSDGGLKIIGAFNPTNIADEVGKRCEPPQGWGMFDPDVDYDWVSTRGWRVVRLDASRCENVVEKRTIYPGLQTHEGFEALISNAGGTDSPGYWSMGRGCFPPAGTSLSIIPPGFLTNFRCEPIWYDTPTPVGSVDLALEGSDSAIFSKGIFGLASGVKFPPSLEHPAGRTEMFSNHQGQKRPRFLLLIESQLNLPRGDTVTMKEEIKRVCRSFGIRADHLCLDRSGNGQGVYDLLRHEFGEVIGVNYSESAGDTRVMTEDHDVAKELYSRADSELWFALRKFLEFGYFRGALSIETEPLFSQLTGRRYRNAGKRARVESKPDYESRNAGKSPDNADSCTLLVHCVRRGFGFVPGMSPDNSTENAANDDGDEFPEGVRVSEDNRFEYLD